MTARILVVASCLVAAAGLGVSPRSAVAADGEVQRVTDGSPDGYFYNLGGSGHDRYIVEYRDGSFPMGAIICGAQVRELNQGSAPYGVMGGDLRYEDPARPGYPDLSPEGLIAVVDPSSTGPCSNNGTTPRRFTFGDGSGIPAPSGTHYFSAIQPAMGSGPLDFCGVLLDTSSPPNGRSKFYAGGEFGESRWNHFVEEIVSIPRTVRVDMLATGSRHFPGDKGLPVVVVNRPNGEGSVSDDNLSVTVVIDNSQTAPLSRRLAVLADRAVVGNGSGYRDITNAFRLMNGGGSMGGELSLPIGRTVIRAQVDREPIKRRMAAIVDRMGPLNLPIMAALVEEGAGTATGGKSPGGFVGLREVGRGDDGSGDSFFVVQAPVQRGDSLNVTAPTERAPSTPFVVRAVQVVLGEFGGKGLPGLDAIEGRFEDQVMTGSPDMTPGGLIFSVGQVDGMGEIPGGPAPTTVTIDIPDMLIDMESLRAEGPVCDLVVLAVLHPGDFADGVGTAVGADTDPEETLLGLSSFSTSGSGPATKDNTANYMIGLVIDDGTRSLPDAERVTGDPVPYATWRPVGTYIAMDRHGNRID